MPRKSIVPFMAVGWMISVLYGVQRNSEWELFIFGSEVFPFPAYSLIVKGTERANLAGEWFGSRKNKGGIGITLCRERGLTGSAVCPAFNFVDKRRNCQMRG